MAIPDFIDRYHLPKGEHGCSFTEIEDRFLFSKKRTEKWDHFKVMFERLCYLGIKPNTILIDGSFVTGRENPGDVDFAALIPPETVNEAVSKTNDEHDREGILLFANPNNGKALRNLFGSHLLVADSKEMLDIWSNFFRKGQNGKLREPDKSKDPDWVVRPAEKGILKVDL